MFFLLIMLLQNWVSFDVGQGQQPHRAWCEDGQVNVDLGKEQYKNFKDMQNNRDRSTAKPHKVEKWKATEVESAIHKLYFVPKNFEKKTTYPNKGRVVVF